MANLDSYAPHAEVWGYFSGDRTEETGFWSALAEKYGQSVLALMAATGEMAAAVARRGFAVTAVDFIPAMVAEGQRRYCGIPRLAFAEGDVRALRLEQTDYDFAFTSDFNHLMTPADVQAALASIHEHLRPGGGLALELWHPGESSWSSPWRHFDPLTTALDTAARPDFTRTWKEGRGSYDASTRRVTIEQEVFIERGEVVEQFSHSFTLQLYTRAEVSALLAEEGYQMTGEYGGYDRSPWMPESQKWIVEAVRT